MASAAEEFDILYTKENEEVDLDQVREYLKKRNEKKSKKAAKVSRKQLKKQKKEEDKLQPFLDEAVELKQIMDDLNDDINDIDSIYVRLMNTTSSETENVLRNNVVEQRQKIESGIARLKERLGELKAETKACKKEDTVLRVRTNMGVVLGKELLQLTVDYRELLTKWEERLKKRAIRNVRIVAPELEEDQITTALESDEMNNIFAQQMLKDRKGQQTLDFLTEKRNDIYLLEKSIADVQQMFMDLSILVESADDRLDTIEVDMARTKSFTEKATSRLHATKKIVAGTRKKKLIIIIVCGVIILIIAGIIIGIVLALVCL